MPAKHMDDVALPIFDPRLRMADGTFEARADKKDDGKLWITGRISHVSEDRHGTIWKQDAIQQALGSYTTRGLHLNHDMRAQIGRVEDIRVTDKDTQIEAWVGRDFEFPYQANPWVAPVMMNVNNIRSQMEQGLMRGLSIAALCDEEIDKEDKNKRYMLARDIVEFTVCAIPSNRKTLSTVMRDIAAGADCPLCAGRAARLVESDASVQEALAALRGEHSTADGGLEQFLEEVQKWTRSWNKL